MKRLREITGGMWMKKMIVKGFILAAVLLGACSKSGEGTVSKTRPHFERNYTFSDGNVPRNVLESYLSRAILQAEYLNTEGFYNDGVYPYKADDFRMLKEVGAKFIGRAIYSWDIPEAFVNPAFLANAKERVEQMHAYDPEVIFQACLFEIVSTKVAQIPVPDWVFEAFDLPVEVRNFDYTQMLNEEGKFINHWREGASVPDITRIESQLFFYFMAASYIDIGIEALHFGQVELMAMNSNGGGPEAWDTVLKKVREYAQAHARRGTVLCDGHMGSGGMVIDGRLLFDFVSFPMRIKEIIGDPQKGELKKFHLDAIYGRTKGGITPSGWSCDQVPYIVELDNFGISDHPGTPNLNDHFVWGFDEISWFAKQPEAYRNEFLQYADGWIERVDPNGFIQMPGSRVTTGTEGNRYRANAPSDSCPLGMGQEQIIKTIWNQ
ncbi:hypothetical protein [Parapedobacter defluvii]|uniref:hypothetical protein n=1 Tax=Parapedobacter defluvii TaxID=2045106 RepID=UPI00333F3474